MAKKLLTITALLEGGTGLLLMAVPNWILGLLLGAESLDAAAMAVARIAGAAIFSLAIACWFTRESELAGAVVKAMLFYNLTVASILVYGNLASDLGGFGMWPAIGAHLVLGIGCIVALRKRAKSKR